MEQVFLDREVNGDAFDARLLKHWNTTYGKKKGKNARQTQEEINAAKRRHVVTYNDNTIGNLIKRNRKEEQPTEKACS